MRVWTIALAALFFAALPSMAWAADHADHTVGGEAQALVKQGLEQYQNADYDAAAATFRKAYALEPSPRLAFNAARAYDKAGRTSQAIAYYELYVYSPDTEPDIVAKAVESLARLRAERTEKEVPPPPPDKPVTPPPVHEEVKPASHTLSYALLGSGAAVIGVAWAWACGPMRRRRTRTRPSILSSDQTFEPPATIGRSLRTS